MSTTTQDRATLVALVNALPRCDVPTQSSPLVRLDAVLAALAADAAGPGAAVAWQRIEHQPCFGQHVILWSARDGHWFDDWPSENGPRKPTDWLSFEPPGRSAPPAKATATPRVACILDLDSPSYPPGVDEYQQCGCPACALKLQQPTPEPSAPPAVLPEPGDVEALATTMRALWDAGWNAHAEGAEATGDSIDLWCPKYRTQRDSDVLAALRRVSPEPRAEWQQRAEARLGDIHLMARRAMHRPEKAPKYLGYIVEWCEQLGVPPASVLRDEPAPPPPSVDPTPAEPERETP